MRLDHTEPVLGYDGERLRSRDNADSPERDLTFRDLAAMALGFADERDGAELKARIFGLALKFYRGNKVSLTVDEASLLKDRAGRALSAMAYGRLCQWVEGEPQVGGDAEDDDDSEGGQEGARPRSPKAT